MNAEAVGKVLEMPVRSKSSCYIVNGLHEEVRLHYTFCWMSSVIKKFILCTENENSETTLVSHLAHI